MKRLYPVLIIALIMAMAIGACQSTNLAAPRAITQVRPVYPFECRRTGLTGFAEVEFIVDTTGKVTEAHATSANHPLFAAAAVTAILKWKFEPGRVDGRPVNTKNRQRFSFDITP
ncbi:MAG: energy transducer TonB [Opitutaceae bacterium]|nr:energy transducer TonB [Opitutaceae bacterium]